MTDINDKISEEKLIHYLNLTKEARKKATPIHEKGTEQDDMLTVLLRMADDYTSDAQSEEIHSQIKSLKMAFP